MSKPKPSELFETAIMLMEEDENGELLQRDERGNPQTICTMCTYTTETCEVCPFNGDTERVESLRALIPIIKTMELLDD